MIIGIIYLTASILLTILIVYRVGHSWAASTVPLKVLLLGLFGISFGAIQRGFSVAFDGSYLKEPSGVIDLIAFAMVAWSLLYPGDKRIAEIVEDERQIQVVREEDLSLKIQEVFDKTKGE